MIQLTDDDVRKALEDSIRRSLRPVERNRKDVTLVRLTRHHGGHYSAEVDVRDSRGDS